MDVVHSAMGEPHSATVTEELLINTLLHVVTATNRHNLCSSQGKRFSPRWSKGQTQGKEWESKKGTGNEGVNEQILNDI